MNLRQSITRKITYTKVIVKYKKDDEVIKDEYIAYGKTTPAKEMKKLLKNSEFETLPVIVCNTVTEKRAISLENFLKYSIIINESEEN